MRFVATGLLIVSIPGLFVPIRYSHPDIEKPHIEIQLIYEQPSGGRLIFDDVLKMWKFRIKAMV